MTMAGTTDKTTTIKSKVIGDLIERTVIRWIRTEPINLSTQPRTQDRNPELKRSIRHSRRGRNTS